MNFCPPRSSTGKWVVLRRELGGKAVDEKSVTVGVGVGYQEDPRWAKKSTLPVRGGILKKHPSCTVSIYLSIYLRLMFFVYFSQFVT